METRRAAWVVVAALLGASGAPMQCPASDRRPVTEPDAPEECYALAERLRERGDLEGWRIALEYVIERFPDSRWAARARDDLRGVGGTPLVGADGSP